MFHIKKSFYACLISTLVCENGNALAAVPPSADEVAKVTIELWKSKKILELERYVTAYIRHYPQTIAAARYFANSSQALWM